MFHSKRLPGRFSKGRTPLLAVLLLAAGLLGACGPGKEGRGTPPQASFMNTDVTGLGYARDFSLTDANGMPRTLKDYRGKVLLMFFGFTQCPDVCPTTLSNMAEVKKQLGRAGKDLQVAFVTIDAERDTPEILKQYVPSFDPTFIALRGDPQQTEDLIREFKLYVKKSPGKRVGEYTMDHTAGSYVFDRTGHIRLFLKNDEGPENIVHDLSILLAEPASGEPDVQETARPVSSQK